MAVSIYLLPIVGTGAKGDSRRPAHLDILAGLDWSMIDDGAEPVCLLGVLDPPAAVQASMAAQADVTVVPANLDATVGGGVNAARTALESRNIPGTWIASTDTWRTIVHTVGGCFLFFQRCNGLGLTTLFTGGVTLATQWQALPAPTRQTLLAAATSFGYDTSSVQNTTTLRAIFKTLADQWGSVPINLAGVTI